MQTRPTHFIRNAAIGASFGAATAGVIAYSLSGDTLCHYIPGYLDAAISKSSNKAMEKLGKGFGNIFSKLGSVTGYVPDIITNDKVTNWVGKLSNSIPLNADAMSAVGKGVSYVASKLGTKMLPSAIAAEAGALAFDAAKGLIQASLVEACAEMLAASSIVPVACLVGTVTGATAGVIVETVRYCAEKSSLQSHSMFNASPRAVENQDNLYKLKIT